MTLKARLKKIMKQRDMRVADLARSLGRSYTTVREWVLFGRVPSDLKALERALRVLEREKRSA